MIRDDTLNTPRTETNKDEKVKKGDATQKNRLACTCFFLFFVFVVRIFRTTQILTSHRTELSVRVLVYVCERVCV